ncbi:hypothetical protein Q3H58_004275 [Pseudomonas psychrotolerans]|nr:hypothetical protein [Pseudomonas psychrotolerans]
MANAGEILHPWDVTDYLQTEEEIALFSKQPRRTRQTMRASWRR